jgi:hypothetical protein
LPNQLLESSTVDSWHGDENAQPFEQKQAQGNENLVAQPFGLNDFAENFCGAGIAPPARNHDEG